MARRNILEKGPETSHLSFNITLSCNPKELQHKARLLSSGMWRHVFTHLHILNTRSRTSRIWSVQTSLEKSLLLCGHSPYTIGNWMWTANREVSNTKTLVLVCSSLLCIHVVASHKPYFLNATLNNKLMSIHSFSILSDDRSKASSKTIPPHSAI